MDAYIKQSTLYKRSWQIKDNTNTKMKLYIPIYTWSYNTSTFLDVYIQVLKYKYTLKVYVQIRTIKETFKPIKLDNIA